MVPGAVREDTAVREHPAVTADEGTPGLITSGEMSPRMLALLVLLSLGVVVALTGSHLRDGFSWGTEPSKAPATGTRQPANADSAKPAAPPRPAPAAPAVPPPPPPAPAPQTQDYAPAPVEAQPDTPASAAPMVPPPPPAPIPDILAPILPWLMPPPPPPPPPSP